MEGPSLAGYVFFFFFHLLSGFSGFPEAVPHLEKGISAIVCWLDLYYKNRYRSKGQATMEYGSKGWANKEYGSKGQAMEVFIPSIASLINSNALWRFPLFLYFTLRVTRRNI